MKNNRSKRLKVFTWHVHGSYLYYLSQANIDFYIPLDPGNEFSWEGNVIQVPKNQISDLEFNAIIFQAEKNYLEDQFKILNDKQRKAPKIYLEHNPPREHPTDTKHIVGDPNILLVHVTHFNNLMWDSGRTPTKMIDHGVVVPEEVSYIGDKPKGIVVINNLKKRGRRLGRDLFERARKEISLDLIGMGSEELGGLGEIPITKLPEFISHYRFFFNPIRYTSLGLSVCEAMSIGMPVVALATTEMVTAVQNGVSGFVDTNVDSLIEKMRYLLIDKQAAEELGIGAKRYAEKRFGILRFALEWEETVHSVVDKKKSFNDEIKEVLKL